MKTKIFTGELADKPVIITMQTQSIAFVLLKTNDNIYKKFVCKIEDRLCSNTDSLTNKMFANVVLSSAGDMVQIGVPEISNGIEGSQIVYFRNDTKNIWCNMANI